VLGDEAEGEGAWFHGDMAGRAHVWKWMGIWDGIGDHERCTEALGLC
jgi:hypothetical protein